MAFLPIVVTNKDVLFDANLLVLISFLPLSIEFLLLLSHGKGYVFELFSSLPFFDPPQEGRGSSGIPPSSTETFSLDEKANYSTSFGFTNVVLLFVAFSFPPLKPRSL
jgi:hypothetical protein